MSPEVTIVTPAFNSEAYIAETLKSAQNQTYSNWELLVIDDGSVDRTAQIASDFSKNDPRIRLLQLERNQGVANARNHGLKAASGKFIAFLDSDDVWKPKKLELQLEFMKSSNCGFSYTGYEVMNCTNKIIRSRPCESPSVNYEGLISKNIIGCLTVMIDRKEMGSLKFEKRGHEDYIFWLALLKQIGVARGLAQNLAVYRIHNKSISANKFRAVLWTWYVLRREGLTLVDTIRNILVRQLIKLPSAE